MATEAVLMADQKSKLIRREEVAEGTIAFHFGKPSGFAFKAGQSADVTLIDPPDTDAEGNTRTFSIASPPFENELVFTTRMRDTAFKRSLKNVPLATEVKIGSAAGSFTLHKNPAKPAVFLAGGIGITPFLSMGRQADHDRLPHKLYLFYSNRRPEDAAFLAALQNLEKTNPNFRLICTMTEMSKSKKDWKGETALIDKEMLSRHLAVLQGPIYYIAGPPTMVAAMRQTLVGAGDFHVNGWALGPWELKSPRTHALRSAQITIDMRSQRHTSSTPHKPSISPHSGRRNEIDSDMGNPPSRQRAL